MLLGVLIGKKSYAAQKYFFVLMIVLGVGLFIFKDKYEMNDSEELVTGSYLIGFSLLMDGLTGAVQDRLRAHAKPSWMSFMYNVNVWSSGILVTVMAASGEGRDMIQFSLRHPEIVWQITLVVFVGTIGQVFLSLMIANFGSLPLSLVTTTRKFFTVLVSVITFGNELSIRQWIAVVVIFASLLLDAVFTKKSKSGEENTVEITDILEDKDSNLKHIAPELEAKPVEGKDVC